MVMWGGGAVKTVAVEHKGVRAYGGVGGGGVRTDVYAGFLKKNS